VSETLKDAFASEQERIEMCLIRIVVRGMCGPVLLL